MSNLERQAVIVGSGLSGLMTAYELAKSGVKSLIISKGPLIQTNTWMAQGGVAAAVSSTDSIENHLSDTLTAGDGLCIKENVQKILSIGPELIQNLIQSGMIFDKDGSLISLGKEGGHGQRRILHVDDQTGKALHEFLLHKLQSKDLSSYCSFIPNSMVQSATKKGAEFELDLFDINSNSLFKISCSHIVLATGGAGKAFLYTSNWEGATGDGLKIAHDLGAKLKNLEMVQFHPTCLFHSQERNFLISEALRGEGALLIDHSGNRFAHNFHEDGELAPRDIVSRAIESQIKTTGKDCVYLDIRHKSEAYLKKRFPTIFDRCLSLGINISTDPIPVIPAAHYTCGGISTKSDLVSTDVKNLFAIGECAYTGLHGANRLASNSLLECLVTAHLCANNIIKVQKDLSANILKSGSSTQNNDTDLFLVNALWEEVRSIMWNYVGIQRSTKRLNFAFQKIKGIEGQTIEWLSGENTKDIQELKNIIFFSKHCISSALKRKESRGCHFIQDYPRKEEQLYTTTIHQNELSLEKLID